jgi:hypothetical protein
MHASIPPYVFMPRCLIKHRDNFSFTPSVGIATGYGLDGRGVGVRVPVGETDFSLLHDVQTRSGAQPGDYTTGTGEYFPGDKAAGA